MGTPSIAMDRTCMKKRCMNYGLLTEGVGIKKECSKFMESASETEFATCPSFQTVQKIVRFGFIINMVFKRQNGHICGFYFKGLVWVLTVSSGRLFGS